MRLTGVRRARLSPPLAPPSSLASAASVLAVTSGAAGAAGSPGRSRDTSLARIAALSVIFIATTP